MATFPIYPLARFESGQTSIRRPREFLCFSFDENHKIHHFSEDSVRYYYPPFVESPGTQVPPISLSNGFETWIGGDDTIDSHLDGLLETIQAHEERLMNDGTTELEDVRTKADIVTWRGMMTKMLTAPFDMFNEFEMNATCYQGTIFIEENHSYKLAQDSEQHSHKPPRRGEIPQAMMQYWGHKFESLSVLSKPWAESTRTEIASRDSEVVNSNTQYCSIVRTSIGPTSLVLGGEVDCIMGEKPVNPDDPIPWVELKTSAEILNNREEQKYERKLLKFWAQSFLLGVPKIIVGFRTADGFLTRISELETQRIPGMVSRGTGTWNGNVCINMTAAFLEFLKQTIMGEDGVWRIKRAKNEKAISVFKVQDEGTGEILRPSFKEHRDTLLAKEVAHKLGG